MNTVSFKSHVNKVTAFFQLRWHFLNKASFFQLRAFLKIKNFFLSADFRKIIPAFISRRPDSCSSLYFGITQALLSRLLAQKAAVQPLTVKGGSTVDRERHTYTYSWFTNDSWLWAVGQSWRDSKEEQQEHANSYQLIQTSVHALLYHSFISFWRRSWQERFGRIITSCLKSAPDTFVSEEQKLQHDPRSLW